MKFQSILLIDDDRDDREIFQEAIDKLTHEVSYVAFDSAIDALQELKAGRVRPELIFLDLNMPKMSGKEFLTEIKKLDGLKEIPVIIFSTSDNRNNINQTKDLGAYAYITKPYTFDGLIKVLESIL